MPEQKSTMLNYSLHLLTVGWPGRVATKLENLEYGTRGFLWTWKTQWILCNLREKL